MKILPNNIAILENDQWISKWVRESGRLDHDQWLLPRALPHIPEGGTVIDIGAFIGDHTIAYANKVGKCGWVIAFEPNPAAFECLQHNMSSLHQVNCINGGVGESNESIGLEIHPHNAGATYPTEAGKIKCQTIDGLGDINIDFIKIDAEGFEVKILKGGKNKITTCKPVMLIEVNSGALERAGTSVGELLVLLAQYGYTFENIDGTGNLSGPQYDILCKPVKN
jgi:FkbM family methyltransferase